MGRRPRSWLDGAARGGHIGETSKIEHYRWSTTAASRSLSRDQGSSQITTCLIVFSWGALTDENAATQLARRRRGGR